MKTEAVHGRVRAKLARLSERSPLGPPHGFQLGPPASEAALATFERERGVILPPSYRRFLREVGATGAGPGFGLLGLEAWDTAWAWTHDAPPRAGRPCPLPLRLPTTPEGQDWWQTLGISHSAARDGQITIADHGGGRYATLDVTGPHRGRVRSWTVLDAPPATAPYEGFAEWYEAWLDDSLREVDDREFGLRRGGTDVELLLRVEADRAEERAEAVAELGARLRPGPVVVAGLLGASADPSPRVRAAFHEHGVRVATPHTLAAGLADVDPGVRRAAALALARTRASPEIELVEARLAAEHEPSVFRALALWLSKRGALRVEALRGQIDGEEVRERVAALHLLDHALPRAAAVAAARTCLDDPEPEVRRAAIAALAQWPEARSALSGRLEQENDPKVRSALERALSTADED